VGIVGKPICHFPQHAYENYPIGGNPGVTMLCCAGWSEWRRTCNDRLVASHGGLDIFLLTHYVDGCGGTAGKKIFSATILKMKYHLI